MVTGFKTKYSCTCDLHARETKIHITDKKNRKVLHTEIESSPPAFLKVIKPYIKDITVFAESTFNYYWIADVCDKHKIPFNLGHALYIKRTKPKKHKSDDIDTIHMADLAFRNQFPLSYHYPQEMRTARDLFRRRIFLVSKRAGFYKHIQNTFYQLGCTEPILDILRKKSARFTILKRISNPNVYLSIETDLKLIEALDPLIKELEFQAVCEAVHYDKRAFHLLLKMPGVGSISALTILYEMHNVHRFKTAQQFSSYARTVKAECKSAGKTVGKGEDKIGNPTLNWVFHEIAQHMPSASPVIHQWYSKLKSRKGAARARAIFIHKISVAVYYMLKRNEHFDEDRFISTVDNKRTINRVA